MSAVALSTREIAAEAITRYGAQQKLTELEMLLSSLPLPFESVLEIGSWTGGMLWVWSQVARSVVSIDLEERGEPLSVPVERIYGDSHDERTAAQLGDRCFDLVFIDGDHSYEGVKRDYEMYAHRGRYVAIHDIVPHLAISGIHVEPFWAELTRRKRTVEFIDPMPCKLSRQGSYDAGIGLVLP